jgi:hypothetical protein
MKNLHSPIQIEVNQAELCLFRLKHETNERSGFQRKTKDFSKERIISD